MQQNKKFLRVLCSLLAAALAAWCTVLLCRWVGYDLQERLARIMFVATVWGRLHERDNG